MGILARTSSANRCVQEEKQRRGGEIRRRQAAEAKRSWNDPRTLAPVRLGHLPKDAAEKFLQTLGELPAGKQHQEFNGKRLSVMGQQKVISIPIGQRHRLVCRDSGKSLECIEAITHKE